jgi:hypothetical protein
MPHLHFLSTSMNVAAVPQPHGFGPPVTSAPSQPHSFGPLVTSAPSQPHGFGPPVTSAPQFMLPRNRPFLHPVLHQAQYHVPPQQSHEHQKDSVEKHVIPTDAESVVLTLKTIGDKLFAAVKLELAEQQLHESLTADSGALISDLQHECLDTIGNGNSSSKATREKENQTVDSIDKKSISFGLPDLAPKITGMLLECFKIEAESLTTTGSSNTLPERTTLQAAVDTVDLIKVAPETKAVGSSMLPPGGAGGEAAASSIQVIPRMISSEEQAHQRHLHVCSRVEILLSNAMMLKEAVTESVAVLRKAKFPGTI